MKITPDWGRIFQHDVGVLHDLPTTSFDVTKQNNVQDRAGVMAVTNYGDKVYVAECSAYFPSYNNYQVLKR